MLSRQLVCFWQLTQSRAERPALHPGSTSFVLMATDTLPLWLRACACVCFSRPPPPKSALPLSLSSSLSPPAKGERHSASSPGWAQGMWGMGRDPPPAPRTGLSLQTQLVWLLGNRSSRERGPPLLHWQALHPSSCLLLHPLLRGGPFSTITAARQPMFTCGVAWVLFWESRA